MQLSSRHYQHRQSLVLPLVEPYGHQYVQMSPHSCSEPSDFSPTSVIHAPLCKNVYRNGPRFIFRKHIYGLGMFWVASAPSFIYHSPTLSCSFIAFNDHSQEEQVCAPWDPRYDPITALVGRSLSYFKHSPLVKYINQEANQRSANRGSQG